MNGVAGSKVARPYCPSSYTGSDNEQLISPFLNARCVGVDPQGRQNQDPQGRPKKGPKGRYKNAPEGRLCPASDGPKGPDRQPGDQP